MKNKIGKMWIRTKLAAKDNRAALVFVVAWLTANVAVFARVYGMPLPSAALVASCIVKADGGYTGVYQSFTEVVVFGLVASAVVTSVTQRYRPEATCRALAAQASGHVVVVGYTNLGRRVHDLVGGQGRPCVVVEEDAAKVEALVRDEEPLVIGRGRERAILEEAGVARAKVVVLAGDDLETTAIACRIVREMNAECELVVRCPDEDVSALLGRTYRARPVSTSRVAGAFVLAQIAKKRARSVAILGKNNVGEGVAAALTDKRVPFVHVGADETHAALADAEMVVICDDDLGKNLIRVDRVRDVNARATIICRAFHEDAAEVLRRAPFECIVMSTSRHAAEALARAGVFRAVGIDDAPAKPLAALAAA